MLLIKNFNDNFNDRILKFKILFQFSSSFASILYIWILWVSKYLFFYDEYTLFSAFSLWCFLVVCFFCFFLIFPSIIGHFYNFFNKQKIQHIFLLYNQHLKIPSIILGYSLIFNFFRCEIYYFDNINNTFLIFILICSILRAFFFTPILLIALLAKKEKIIKILENNKIKRYFHYTRPQEIPNPSDGPKFKEVAVEAGKILTAAGGLIGGAGALVGREHDVRTETQQAIDRSFDNNNTTLNNISEAQSDLNQKVENVNKLRQGNQQQIQMQLHSQNTSDGEKPLVSNVISEDKISERQQNLSFMQQQINEIERKANQEQELASNLQEELDNKGVISLVMDRYKPDAESIVKNALNLRKRSNETVNDSYKLKNSLSKVDNSEESATMFFINKKQAYSIIENKISFIDLFI